MRRYESQSGLGKAALGDGGSLGAECLADSAGLSPAACVSVSSSDGPGHVVKRPSPVEPVLPHDVSDPVRLDMTSVPVRGGGPPQARPENVPELPLETSLPKTSTTSLPPKADDKKYAEVAESAAEKWTMSIGGHSLGDAGRAFCLEVFAGSAGLTAALRGVGLDAWGLDYGKSKLLALTPALLNVDLNVAAGSKHLRQLLAHPRLCYVHFAPPCGTSSRAREVPLPGGPLPLRSETEPLGLSSLSGKERVRVDLANQLYDLTAQCCEELCVNKKAWSIENPSRSLMWWLPAMVGLGTKPGVKDACFAHCCFGSQRSKKTRWRYFPSGLFSALHVDCKCTSPSQGWGRMGNKFATAAEVSYPSPLCAAVASALLAHLRLSAAPPLDILVHRPVVTSKKVASDSRAAAGIQPRGARCPPVLPEYRETKQVMAGFAANEPCTKPGHKWTSAEGAPYGIPVGSVTLRAFWKGGSGPGGGSEEGQVDNKLREKTVPRQERRCSR